MSRTEQERAKYERMWSVKEYRRNSPGLNIAPTVFEALDPRPGETLMDYGAGEGKALDWFADHGLVTLGVDLVSSLHPRVMNGCLWELDEVLGENLTFDYGFCADVLEHLPTDKVREVLEEIRERTRIAAAFTVATVPCTVGRRHGEELHLTVKDVAWWQEVFDETWPQNRRLETERGWRFLFLCVP